MYCVFVYPLLDQLVCWQSGSHLCRTFATYCDICQSMGMIAALCVNLHGCLYIRKQKLEHNISSATSGPNARPITTPNFDFCGRECHTNETALVFKGREVQIRTQSILPIPPAPDTNDALLPPTLSYINMLPSVKPSIHPQTSSQFCSCWPVAVTYQHYCTPPALKRRAEQSFSSF
jgi:hypothetical protein